MKILIFNNKIDAENRNKQEAVSRGCFGTTIFWWTMIDYDGKYALIVNDDILFENEIPITI